MMFYLTALNLANVMHETVPIVEGDNISADIFKAIDF